MPTARKRHMVTETERVERALAPLRAAGCDIDMGELVVLGAERKLSSLEESARDEEERRKLRRDFLELTRRPGFVDVDALIEVHERGWTHS